MRDLIVRSITPSPIYCNRSYNKVVLILWLIGALLCTMFKGKCTSRFTQIVRVQVKLQYELIGECSAESLSIIQH